MIRLTTKVALAIAAKENTSGMLSLTMRSMETRQLSGRVHLQGGSLT